MTDGLDVVAVGVTDKCPVVAGVVLGPQPRLMQHVGPGTGGGREKLPDGLAAGGRERQVRLAEPGSGALRADTELRPRGRAVTDDLTEVHHPAAA